MTIDNLTSSHTCGQLHDYYGQHACVHVCEHMGIINCGRSLYYTNVCKVRGSVLDEHIYEALSHYYTQNILAQCIAIIIDFTLSRAC